MFLLKALTFGPFVPSFYKNEVNNTPGKKAVLAAVLYSLLASFMVVGIVVAGIVLVKSWLPLFQEEVRDYVNNLNFTYIGLDSDLNLDTDLQPQPFIDDLGYDLVIYIDKNSTDVKPLLANNYRKDTVVAFLKDRAVVKEENSIKLEETFYRALVSSALENSDSMSAEEKKAMLDSFEGVNVTKTELLDFLSNDFSSIIPTDAQKSLRLFVIVLVLILFITIFGIVLIGLGVKAFIFAIVLSIVNKWNLKYCMKFGLIAAMGHSILTFFLKIFLGFVGSILGWIAMAVLILYSLKSLKTSAIVVEK